MNKETDIEEIIRIIQNLRSRGLEYFAYGNQGKRCYSLFKDNEKIYSGEFTTIKELKKQISEIN